MAKAATTGTKKTATGTVKKTATSTAAKKATATTPKKAAAETTKAAPASAKKATTPKAAASTAAPKKAAAAKAVVTTTAAKKPAAKAPAAVPAKKPAAATARPTKTAEVGKSAKTVKASATTSSKTAKEPATSALKKSSETPKSKGEATKSVAPPAPKAPTKPAVTAKPMSKTAIANDPFLSAQKVLLENEKVEYLAQAEALRAEADQMAADAEPGDTQFDEESGEGTTAAVDREHNLRLVSQALQAVDEIERSLDKMPRGTYGLCEHCAEPIAKARLEALPFAALCVACKSGGLTRR